jgi:hypothetical protein
VAIAGHRTTYLAPFADHVLPCAARCRIAHRRLRRLTAALSQG